VILMATSYVTQNRYLYLNTPLGANQLMLIWFTGEEAISRLFRFELGLMAEHRTSVPFDQLLGHGISFGVAGTDERAGKRHLHGVCIMVAQLNRDREFTFYRMEVVPQLWILTQKRQSRIFQQESVPDILKEVLAELEVDHKIQGDFQPREYCVQYRETDFDFASRLMEEEGIYYFFEPGDIAAGHKAEARGYLLRPRDHQAHLFVGLVLELTAVVPFQVKDAALLEARQSVFRESGLVLGTQDKLVECVWRRWGLSRRSARS